MAALLLLFCFIFLVLFFFKKSPSTKRLPPSPLKLPIIGNVYLAGNLPHRSFHSLSKRYGEVMLLQFGSKPVVVASSANAAREIMKNQDLIFASRPRLSIPHRLLYGCRDVGFAAYGDHWRQRRSMCVLRLFSNKRVQSFRPIREEETSLMIEKIKRSSPGVVNLSKVFVELSNDVVSRAVLGRSYGGESDFNRILVKFIEMMGRFDVGDFVPWLGWINRVNGVEAQVEKIFKTMDEFMEGVLREYRMKKLSDDAVVNFADALLELQRESKDSDPVEDDVIKALILDMFVAGTDTTSTSLEWTMTELIRNPRTMKLLQKEVREVARNKNGKDITEDDLDKMPYLKAVSKESLRLHPPLPLALPRELSRDTNLMGYNIPSGALVLVNSWTISRDPLLWENPDEFRPERFFDIDIDYKGLHFEMIPFGAGRRGCPGITFAMSLYELAISRLVNDFNFGLLDGDRLEDLDITEAFGIIVHKKCPLLVVPTPCA
ncbi:(+)-menthofuran synthase-like [Salvia hispanica]|uniref:(+)-menthofuran synthase-like n=1 Tax=Salvia hispanica TaxID=49212 RepID=UPI0020093EB8|nr:(+)-menthofuran synthase-like [Salvia hispanica]